MQHSDFVHLHTHTQYSLLDGACHLEKLLDLAKAYKMPALAITDHGNMFGAIEFYNLAFSKGIKPIIGCEVYIAPGSRFEKSAGGIQEASFHLILLCKDETGYKNLIKLVSYGFLEGFYYRPRIDKEILAKHSEGLICLSSCLKGEIPHLILQKKYAEAEKLAIFYKETFGKDNFYLEIQDNLIPEQAIVNDALINLSKKLDIGLVATNDVHYLHKADAHAHETLLSIQTQTTLDDPNRMRFQTNEFYFKDPEIMKKSFNSVAPEAIKNTILIAERCNLELDFSKTHLPHYKTPDGKSREEFLKELVETGLKKRYSEINKKISDRVNYELSVIQKSGYTSYFLIAWDFVNHAKEKNIPVGPGRGSAAGSVVSYALGITDIDPLRYDLLFERFLNPERVSLPDIDIDFCYERRNEVIAYVVSKYSKDNVCQIITFGTMMARAVIRDVGRAMGMPYGDVDKIAKLIPFELNMTLDQALKVEPQLKDMYKNNPEVTKLIDTAKTLEGLTRHASTHAAGVVIAEEPLINLVPLFKTGDDQITTQYAMSSLEKLGVLKMDFLGLRTLTVISEAVKIIKRTRSIDLEINKIPLDDKKTFEMLSRAESMGVFQLESSGMRDLLKKLKPEKFEDLIALLALFRPGPIGSGLLDDFMSRKHGKTPIKYDHKKLELILRETYGIILYQEQVMRIASDLAGFSLAEADSLRRAISKKTPEVMTEARKKFTDGCRKNKIDEKTATKIFDQVEYFAGYGFNKSHSAAYAMISYRTAYLKANFTIEFMTALLTSEKDNTDKIVEYINESGRLNIPIKPPDINESFAKFTVTENSIRFGLSAIKNVGKGAIDSIITAREKYTRFNSIYDFCEHIDMRLVNRKVLESLIKSGAMDSFGLKRSQLMASLDKALEIAGSVQKDRLNGQLSFFDKPKSEDNFKDSFHEIPDMEEWPEHQLLIYEKEMLGFYITKHPLARYEKIIKSFTSVNSSNLKNSKDNDLITLGGIISKAKFTVTKRTGERMAILNLEDFEGNVETLVFPKTFQKYAHYVKVDSIVFIKGRLSLKEDTPKIIAEEIMPVEEAWEKFIKSVSIKLHSNGLEKKHLEDLKKVFSNNPGKIPVYLNFITADNKSVEVLANKTMGVKLSDSLLSDIEKIAGENTIKFNVSQA